MASALFQDSDHAFINGDLRLGFAQTPRPGKPLADSCFAVVRNPARPLYNTQRMHALFNMLAANTNNIAQEYVRASSCIVAVKAIDDARIASDLVIGNTGDSHVALIRVEGDYATAEILTHNNQEAGGFFSLENRKGEPCFDKFREKLRPYVTEKPFERLPGTRYLLSVFTDGALPGVDGQYQEEEKRRLEGKIGQIVSDWLRADGLGEELDCQSLVDFSHHRIRESQKIEQDCVSILIKDITSQNRNVVLGVFDGNRAHGAPQFAQALAAAAYDKA